MRMIDVMHALLEHTKYLTITYMYIRTDYLIVSSDNLIFNSVAENKRFFSSTIAHVSSFKNIVSNFVGI